jgi:hypothetical protein
MSARTSAQLIDGYVVRLKAELSFLGAAEVEDLVAEIRSLLVEAAGDDPTRAAAEGMSTAEWWRMGVAVPLDIVVGLAVPVAVALPAYAVAANGEPRAWSVALGIAVFACAVAWAWYVWKPWRSGGPRRTAGMALTGLTVVRAPGFRRVVRSKDLEALGLRISRTSAVFGLLAVAVAIVIVGVLGYEIYLSLEAQAPMGVFERTAGAEAEQILQATQPVASIYDSLVAFGVNVGGENYVSPMAMPAYELLLRRAATDKVTGYEIGDVTKISLGAWKVPVTETTAGGTRRVEFTVTLRIRFHPDYDGGYAYGPDWEIYEIAGEGLKPTP